MNDPTRHPLPKLSVIVACYKDGQAIPYMYERLQKALAPLPLVPELIFVNDGSPDDSEEVLRALAAKDPRVVAINHTRNFGSQAPSPAGWQLCDRRPGCADGWRPAGSAGADSRSFSRNGARDTTSCTARASNARARVSTRSPTSSSTGSSTPSRYIDIPLDAGDFSLMDRQGDRRAQQHAGARPFPARYACLGRLSTDRRAVHAPGAHVRASRPTTCGRISAGRGRAFSPSHSCRWRRSPTSHCP